MIAGKNRWFTPPTLKRTLGYLMGRNSKRKPYEMSAAPVQMTGELHFHCHRQCPFGVALPGQRRTLAYNASGSRKGKMHHRPATRDWGNKEKNKGKVGVGRPAESKMRLVAGTALTASLPAVLSRGMRRRTSAIRKVLFPDRSV